MSYQFSDWQAGARPPKGFDVADCTAFGWSNQDLQSFLVASVCDVLPDFPAEPVAGAAQDDDGEEFDAPPGPTLPTNRPVIKFVESELPGIVDAACQALIDAEVKIYARGTSLVRPISLGKGQAARVKRKQGALILNVVDETSMVEILTSAIDFRKYNVRQADWVPCAAPSAVAKTILARRGEWPFPQLLAITTAPTLRDDWSVVSSPGFDDLSGIFFEPGDTVWPAIKNNPTRADAQIALGELIGLVEDFPFVGPADRAGALAMILSSLVRPSLPTAPMFGVSAPVPGSGKSKLVDIAAILATGRNAAVMSAPREEEELRKAVGAALMAGDAFLNIDNVDHSLRSEFLCQTLTQEMVKVRVLGQSLNLDLPTNATFAATGNGLRFAGDLTRRVVLIGLDPGMERPEERVFSKDAVQVARQGRVKFVIAGLTIMLAFVEAKVASVKPALGSFEKWSDIIRSALVWLGETDPLENSRRVREADPERERTLSILHALPAGEWRCSELARWLKEDDLKETRLKEHVAMSDALAEFCERGNLSTRRFGEFLKNAKDRPIEGMTIRFVRKDRKGIAVWTVEGRTQTEQNSGQTPDGKKW